MRTVRLALGRMPQGRPVADVAVGQDGCNLGDRVWRQVDVRWQWQHDRLRLPCGIEGRAGLIVGCADHRLTTASSRPIRPGAQCPLTPTTGSALRPSRYLVVIGAGEMEPAHDGYIPEGVRKCLTWVAECKRTNRRCGSIVQRGSSRGKRRACLLHPDYTFGEEIGYSERTSLRVIRKD